MTDQTPTHSAPTASTPPLPGPGRTRAWWQAPASRSALAWFIAAAARAHDGVLLAVTRDNHAATQLEADLHTLVGNDAGLPVLAFPDWETLPYDRFSPHPEIVSQRLATLRRLPMMTRGVVVVPVQTLMQRLPPLSYVVGNSFDLRVGQRLDLDAEKRRLQAAGYRNVPQVYDPGDFAVRGALLDVYPMGEAAPFRIELLDDEIDTIRVFDPESQRSLERVPALQLMPGREVPLDEAARTRALDALREHFDIDTRRSALFQDLKAGAAPAGIEYYLPLFFERGATATLFDYLGETALPLVDDGVGAAADYFWTQAGQRHEQRRHDVEHPVLPPGALWLAPDELRARFNDAPRIELAGEGHARRDDAVRLGAQPAPALPVAARHDAAAAPLKEFLASYPGRVLVSADTAGRREALLEVLDAAALRPQVLPDFRSFASGDARFAISVAPFEDGFALDPGLADTERAQEGSILGDDQAGDAEAARDAVPVLTALG